MMEVHDQVGANQVLGRGARMFIACHARSSSTLASQTPARYRSVLYLCMFLTKPEIAGNTSLLKVSSVSV
ncbi:hypothetical protein RRF57_012646 [Xylaria bambusicola]|uniref:Uncharacterized protein n=1 Tax=Xylaria bambusicola TaxID=326684 RepID=A0AAN7V5U7_9PEZI